MFVSDLIIIIWLYIRGTGTETCWMGNLFLPGNLKFDNIPTRIVLNFRMMPKHRLLTRSAANGTVAPPLLFFRCQLPGQTDQSNIKTKYQNTTN